MNIPSFKSAQHDLIIENAIAVITETRVDYNAKQATVTAQIYASQNAIDKHLQPIATESASEELTQEEVDNGYSRQQAEALLNNKYNN